MYLVNGNWSRRRRGGGQMHNRVKKEFINMYGMVNTLIGEVSELFKLQHYYCI